MIEYPQFVQDVKNYLSRMWDDVTMPPLMRVEKTTAVENAPSLREMRRAFDEGELHELLRKPGSRENDYPR